MKGIYKMMLVCCTLSLISLCGSTVAPFRYSSFFTATSSPNTHWFSRRHQLPTLLSQPMMLLSIYTANAHPTAQWQHVREETTHGVHQVWGDSLWQELCKPAASTSLDGSQAHPSVLQAHCWTVFYVKMHCYNLTMCAR